jgi:hypothetical protein
MAESGGRFCPLCGEAAGLTDRFCRRCGESLRLPTRSQEAPGGPESEVELRGEGVVEDAPEVDANRQGTPPRPWWRRLFGSWR